MKRVDVNSIEIGMVLAEPVYNHQEEVLFEAGAALQEKDIWVLKSWGVEQVSIRKESIENRPSDDNGEVDAQHEERISETLESKFSDVLDDPVMAEIMRVAKKLQERRYSKIEWDDDDRQSFTDR
jgi:hypothetical protein